MNTTHLTTKKNTKGFTLIELVVVIAVLAILFAITLVAINPARQFQTARDTQRASDVNAILNAVHQYLAVPGNTTTSLGLTTSVQTILAPVVTDATEVDLCPLLITTGNYIAQMPVDPSNAAWTSCAAYNSGYRISANANGRITVAATAEVPGVTISVTR